MGPRDSLANYPINLLDLAATAWDPPNLPLFPGAPAPTGAPVAVSAPAAGTYPWLRPLHEIQQTALSRNPFDPASTGDTATSPWTSGWSATPPIPAAEPPNAARPASNPYLGSAAGAGGLDPVRTRRLLAEAKRDYDFAARISGDPSIGSSLPTEYVAAATDAPRPSTPNTSIDDAVAQPAPVNRPPASWSTQVNLSALAGHPVYPPPPSAAPSPPIAAPEDAGLPQTTAAPQPQPAAPSAADAPLTNNASWDPRTWTAYDNPLAWLQLDYERKFPSEAARLKGMPIGGDVPAFDAPNAARRMGEAFATGYGDQPIIPTQDPGGITNAGQITIPEWARPHVIALMRAGNSLPQALDQILRASRGAIAMVPAMGAGAAQDLGIVDPRGADKLQGELGIFTQFPGEPGVPSLAAAPRLVPEPVGQRVLRRVEERPLLPRELLEPNVGLSHIADFRARHNVSNTTHTIAIGRTNVPGLEDLPFEGASPAVRQEAELPPTIPGEIESPSQIPRDRRHAEEDLFNQFIRKVEERRLRPSDVEGKLVIYISNPNGVCSVCRWGLDDPNVRPGVIKQFSKLYPKLTIELSVATQPGIKTIGPSRFTIRDGAYVRRSDR